MAFVEVNPDYQELLQRCRLVAFDDFLALPAVIVSGHPDRHVARVTLGEGPAAVGAFLKREHRMPWRDRLVNAWAGFGFVSKSYREKLLLQALRQAGIGCPDWIAVGEDGQGRAFLLVRELTGTADLRIFLHDLRFAPAQVRRRFARRLGAALAHVHNAGFEHHDLYSKHILVGADAETIRFLDWQRSRHRRCLGWPQRWHDLAALHATVGDDLATARDRLVCLRAYLRSSALQTPVHVLTQINREAQRLLRRRSVRELRQLPMAAGEQSLIWLDGEALCVTPEFRASLNGRLPTWLVQPSRPHGPRAGVLRMGVPMPGRQRGQLIRRWAMRPLQGLWSWLRRQRPTSPELRQAGLLFRLQRHGIGLPRLLAVGQRQRPFGRIESFLLTMPPADTIGLGRWLLNHACLQLSAAERTERRRLVREAGIILRRMHDAGCYLGNRLWALRPHPEDGRDCPLRIQLLPGEPAAVVLGRVEDVQTCRRPRSALALRDMQALRHSFATTLGSRTDEMRFLLTYLGLRHLTPAGKALAAGLLRQGVAQFIASGGEAA